MGGAHRESVSAQAGARLKVDAESFPRLAGLLAEDKEGALARELQALLARVSPANQARPVAVALLQGASREALAVMQDMSAAGVRIRVDRRHRALIKADVKLVVNDNGHHAALPIEFVRTDEDGRDIDLAYRFVNLTQDQQRLVDRLQVASPKR